MDFVLNWERARLYAHWDEPITESVKASYREAIARREQGEPVAYIRNRKEFLGLDFYVDSRVLIPRPETELLVMKAIDWLDGHPDARVVELGTGSGAIAVSILYHRPGVNLLATDVSEDVLAVATLNAAKHGVDLWVARGSLLEPLEAPVDLVVANLPYLSHAEMEGLQDTSIRFEPRVALDGGEDGLDVFRALFTQVPGKLTEHGCLLLEIGAGQEASLVDLAATELPAFKPTVFPDYAGLPRVLQLER